VPEREPSDEAPKGLAAVAPQVQLRPVAERRARRRVPREQVPELLEQLLPHRSDHRVEA
jgi:hypothetical protein